MRRITVSEFQAELAVQGVPNKHLALKCPVCGTVQSMSDFVAANASVEEAELKIGFSCVGRLTNAGPYIKGKSKPGSGCDWTLGGLLRLHELEVIDADGIAHPRFEIATPEEAQAHASVHPEMV